jgi:hypothetical protein
MRQLLSSPRVYEFDAAFHGSYPPWDDPSYWYDGAQTRLHLKKQVQRLLSGAASYERILQGQAAWAAGALFLILLAWPAFGNWAWHVCSLLLVGAAGLGVYAPIRADNRYVGPFFILIWAALFAALYLHHLKERRQLLAPLAIAISVIMLLPIATALGGDMGQTVQRVRSGAAFDHSDAEVAAYLLSMGIGPGGRVAYIQSTSDTFNKYWARLAKVTIVADMPYQDVDQFWNGSAAAQRKVVAAFGSAGAEALVAYKVPEAGRGAGWERAGKTDYYVLRCEQVPPAAGVRSSGATLK